MKQLHVSLIAVSKKLPGPLLSLNDTWSLSDSPQIPSSPDGLPCCPLLGHPPATSLLGEAAAAALEPGYS